jgi:uncharacterized protein VirK/YbjX
MREEEVADVSVSLSLSLSVALSQTHSYAPFCLLSLHIQPLPVLCIGFTQIISAGRASFVFSVRGTRLKQKNVDEECVRRRTKKCEGKRE